MQHRNARLTPTGRHQLVLLVEERGFTFGGPRPPLTWRSRRCGSGSGAGVRRAPSGLLRGPRNRSEAVDDRQPLLLLPQRQPGRAARWAAGSGTSSSRPGGHRPTARSSATNRRSNANGRSRSATAHLSTAPAPCHAGSTTTTSAAATQPSATTHRSAAFGTSQGGTASASRTRTEQSLEGKRRRRFAVRPAGWGNGRRSNRRARVAVLRAAVLATAPNARAVGGHPV
jgi:hypothetical protein